MGKFYLTNEDGTTVSLDSSLIQQKIISDSDTDSAETTEDPLTNIREDTDLFYKKLNITIPTYTTEECVAVLSEMLSTEYNTDTFASVENYMFSVLCFNKNELLAIIFLIKNSILSYTDLVALINMSSTTRNEQIIKYLGLYNPAVDIFNNFMYSIQSHNKLRSKYDIASSNDFEWFYEKLSNNFLPYNMISPAVTEKIPYKIFHQYLSEIDEYNLFKYVNWDVNITWYEGFIAGIVTGVSLFTGAGAIFGALSALVLLGIYEVNAKDSVVSFNFEEIIRKYMNLYTSFLSGQDFINRYDGSETYYYTTSTSTTDNVVVSFFKDIWNNIVDAYNNTVEKLYDKISSDKLVGTSEFDALECMRLAIASVFNTNLTSQSSNVHVTVSNDYKTDYLDGYFDENTTLGYTGTSTIDIPDYYRLFSYTMNTSNDLTYDNACKESNGHPYNTINKEAYDRWGSNLYDTGALEEYSLKFCEYSSSDGDWVDAEYEKSLLHLFVTCKSSINPNNVPMIVSLQNKAKLKSLMMFNTIIQEDETSKTVLSFSTDYYASIIRNILKENSNGEYSTLKLSEIEGDKTALKEKFLTWTGYDGTTDVSIITDINDFKTIISKRLLKNYVEYLFDDTNTSLTFDDFSVSQDIFIKYKELYLIKRTYINSERAYTEMRNSKWYMTMLAIEGAGVYE